MVIFGYCWLAVARILWLFGRGTNLIVGQVWNEYFGPASQLAGSPGSVGPGDTKLRKPISWYLLVHIESLGLRGLVNTNSGVLRIRIRPNRFVRVRVVSWMPD